MGYDAVLTKEQQAQALQPKAPTEAEIAMSNRLAQIKNVYDTANPNVNKGTKAEETITKAIPDSERAGNRATYLYNKVLEGVGSTLSGLGDLAVQGASVMNTGVLDASPVTRKLYRENIAPNIRTYLKDAVGAKTDKGLEARYNNETITSALGGIFNSAPAMLTTAASGGLGTMAMFAQSFDNAIESINQSEEGKNLDEATKSFFAGGVGIATALLEKYSFDKIFKGETGLIGNAIAKRALRNASEETGGKVTGDVFSKFLDKEIINLTNKYVKGGARLLDASLVEYATEASQEAAQAGAELLVNKETGKPVFDTSETSTWYGFLNRINKAGVAGAIGGAFMGGLSMGISNLAGVKPSVIEESQSRLDDINNALENENVSDTAKEVLVQEKIKIQDEAQKIADKVDETYAKLDDKQKERVNEIVEEKAKLQEVLADENVPDSVKENITKQDEDLTKELSEIKPLEEVKPSEPTENTITQEEVVTEPKNPNERVKIDSGDIFTPTKQTVEEKLNSIGRFIKDKLGYNIKGIRVSKENNRVELDMGEETINFEDGMTLRLMGGGQVYPTFTPEDIVRIVEKNTNTSKPVKNQESIKNIYDSDTKIKNVGTEQEFKDYSDSIFPESKIKDVVYHGTNNEFKTFEKGHTDAKNSKTDTQGIHFIDEGSTKEYGDNYGRMVPAKLDFKNPLEIEATRENADMVERLEYLSQKDMDEFKKQGYDSAIIKRGNETEYIAFEPEQIVNLSDSDGFKTWKESNANSETSDLQHSEYIKKSFRDSFKSQGNTDEQIDAAIALMDARAKSWASENKSRTPEQWYKDIQDVKSNDVVPNADNIKYQLFRNSDLKKNLLGKVIGVKESAQKEINKELNDIESNAKVNGNWLKAPNGNSTNLTPETWKLVRTKRFKDWFGDWLTDPKNASKIVDENGEPMELFHTSPNEFDTFDKNKIAEDASQEYGSGFYFGKEKMNEYDGYGDKYYSVFLNMRNPKLVGSPNDFNDNHRLPNYSGYKNLEGHDGVIGGFFNLTNAEDLSYSIAMGEPETLKYAVFEPNQIKSTQNIGTFSSKSNSINFQQENGEAKGAVETLKDGKVIIHALKSPDFSTMVHEIAHVFEKDLNENEQQVLRDYGNSEDFARGFERYLRNGDAPSTELKSIFDKAKEWLKNIYQSLIGSPIEKQITPELKQLFDSLLTDRSNEQSKINEDNVKETQKPKEATTETRKESVTGITQEATAKAREAIGMEAYEKTSQSNEQRRAKAEKAIKEGYNVKQLIQNIKNSEDFVPSRQEMEILKIYENSLDAAINKNPTTENIAQRADLIRTVDIGTSRAGAALQAVAGVEASVDNLANFLQAEAVHYGVDELPQNIIDNLKGKYQKGQEAKQAYEAGYQKAKDELIKQQAEAELAKQRKKNKPSVKKSSADYAIERAELKQSIKDKLKKARGQLNAVPVPYLNELIAIAPDVAKLVRSYVEEGVSKLDDIVKRVHSDLKDDIDGITEQDVIDLISGQYNPKRPTKTEILSQVRDLREQAKLLKKIEDLENGKVPNDPVKQVRRNAELEALRKQIKDLEDEVGITEQRTLKSRRNALDNKIKQLQYDLETGNFDLEPAEPRRVRLDAETQKKQDEYIAFLKETNRRRDQAVYEQQSKITKAWLKFQQLLGLRRLIQTSIDFSMPFRQAVTVTLNPRYFRTTLQSFGNMFKSTFSEKKYDRIMFEIQQDPLYNDMRADGLMFSEIDSKDNLKREEDYRTSFLYQIPYLREPFLASNRAAAGYINTARYNLYLKGVERLRSQGITHENSPENYAALAKWTMNMTGRGNLLSFMEKGENASKWQRIMGDTFYGTRLMASRFNMLNPNYYIKMPKEQRIEALKDIGSYVALSGAVALGAIGAGAKVSLDPEDADFLKAKWGDKRYDIFSGGMNTYLRTAYRLLKAMYQRTNPKLYGKNKDQSALDEANKYGKFSVKSGTDFFRYKLAPNTSYVLSATLGKDPLGNDFNPNDIIKFYPMYVDDLKDAMKKDDATLESLSILAPSLFGIGVQQYEQKEKSNKDFLKMTPSEQKKFIDDAVKKAKESYRKKE